MSASAWSRTKAAVLRRDSGKSLAGSMEISTLHDSHRRRVARRSTLAPYSMLYMTEPRHCSCGREIPSYSRHKLCYHCQFPRRRAREWPDCPECGGKMDRDATRCAKCYRGPDLRRDISTQDLIWIAGILEGEGSFVRSGNRIRIACVSTDRDVSEHIYELTGFGIICRPTPRASHHKQAYIWAVQRNAQVQWLSTLLAPLMGLRRRMQISKIIYPPSPCDPTSWAEDEATHWIAGYLEGEGTFSLSAKYNNMRVQAGSTDADVISRLQRLAGMGSFTTRKPAKAHYKDMHWWSISNSAGILQITERIYPLMSIRRKAAIEMLQEKAHKIIASGRGRI